MMNLNALKIDPEFQGKIPPLTFEELNQLEANILRDGRIINPIIVWEGLIVDGHNPHWSGHRRLSGYPLYIPPLRQFSYP